MYTLFYGGQYETMFYFHTSRFRDTFDVSSAKNGNLETNVDFGPRFLRSFEGVIAYFLILRVHKCAENMWWTQKKHEGSVKIAENLQNLMKFGIQILPCPP